jgi:hypothetical protein
MIVALDHVKQCFNAEDGAVILRVLEGQLLREPLVTLSFSGVPSVTSSFVNAALVPFLQKHGIQWVREHLRFVEATRQVADMIRRCFDVAQRSSAA